MNRHARRRHGALLVGIVLTATVSAGCDLIGRDSAGNPTTSVACANDVVSNAALGHVNTCDETAVITTALKVMFSWDPTTDASPQAGALRALPLMTSELAAANQQGPRGQGAFNPGADWLWQRAHGWAVTATVTPGTEDGHTVYQVTQTLTPAPGHTATPSTANHTTVDQLSVVASAVRVASGGFRLAQIQVR